MALSTNTARNLANGVIVFKDGGASSLQKSLTIAIDMGDLKWTENVETHLVHKRKTIAGRTFGRDQACELTFTLIYEAYRGDSSEDVTTPMDVINKEGGAAGWTSTEPSGPHSFDVEFQVTSPETGVDHELIVFPSCCKKTAEFTEGEDYNKIAVTLESLAVKPTVTRVASFS